MRPPPNARRLAVTLLAVGANLTAVAPVAAAEPGVDHLAPATDPASTDPAASDPAVSDPSATDPSPAAPGPEPVAVVSDPAASTACATFSQALNFAAANYDEFAYNSAGEGNHVDYAAPEVRSTNVTGRTALRQAAAAAMSASNTPGLTPEISGPMRSWSLGATKLMLVMALRAGGDRLDSTAGDLNTDAYAVQLACAAAGAPL